MNVGVRQVLSHVMTVVLPENNTNEGGVQVPLVLPPNSAQTSSCCLPPHIKALDAGGWSLLRLIVELTMDCPSSLRPSFGLLESKTIP